jgi:hypothetical protein
MGLTGGGFALRQGQQEPAKLPYFVLFVVEAFEA